MPLVIVYERRPIEVAVEAILAGLELVVDAAAELVAARATPPGTKNAVADIHDAVRGTDHVGARRRTAEIAEVRRRIDGRGEVPQQPRGDAVGRVCGTKLRNSGVSTVKVEPRRAGLPQALVQREEEQPIADDRTAEL